MQAGLLSREIRSVRGAEILIMRRRQFGEQRYRELLTGPARSKNLCMHGISMRDNREIPGSSVWPITGRTAQGSRPPSSPTALTYPT